MDTQTKKTGNKKKGPIMAAILMILIMVFYLAVLVWGIGVVMENPISLFLLIAIMAVPTAVIVGVLVALAQRIKEIEGGEEDEASKY